MDIVVIGGTRGTGRAVVESALAAGHRVTAFGRRPDALDVNHPRLTRIAGDVRDGERVTAAVRGKDAVVFTVGPESRRAPTTSSEGMRNVRAAMEATGVKRLVSVSILGAGESGRGLGVFFNLVLRPFVFRDIILDHERAESLLRESDLDWVIVRPPELTDDAPRGALRASIDPDFSGRRIARRDLAGFLLAQLEEDRFLRRAAAVAW